MLIGAAEQVGGSRNEGGQSVSHRSATRRLSADGSTRASTESERSAISGTGLSHIDARPRSRTTFPTRPRSSSRACRDLARRALARFARVGSVAGDAALIHGARTVMIAGGIVPRFIPFLKSSAFRERFLAKGRMAAHVEAAAIRVITHAAPGLLGAAMYLREGRR